MSQLRDDNFDDPSLIDNEISEQQWKRGAIKRVRVQNFMTYDQAEIEMGPGLNFILGPNGTGKSSLVFTIIIACLGKLKDHERADSLGGFVKTGCDEAYVELTLHDDEAKHSCTVMGRSFKATGGSSTFFMNSKHVKKELYVTRLADYGIKIDNKFQALPQEELARVTQFTPPELLSHLQDLIDPQLVEEQSTLANFQESMNRKAKDLASEEKNQVILTDKFTKVEEEYNQFKELEGMREKHQQLEMKKPWLEYHETTKTEALAKEKMEEALSEYQEKQKPLEPLKKKKLEAKKAFDRTRPKEVDRNQPNSLVRHFANSVRTIDPNISGFKEQIEEAERSEKKRVKEIEKEEARLETINIKIREYQMPDESVKRHLDEEKYNLNKESEEIVAHMRRCDGDIRIIQNSKSTLERNIKELNKHSNFREDSFVSAKSIRGAREIGTCINAIRHGVKNGDLQLRGRFFEPCVLSINLVSNAPKLAASWLEHAISQDIQKAMYFEFGEDLKTVQNFVNRSVSKSVASQMVYVSYETEREYPDPADRAEVKEFGVHGFLSDLFEMDPFHKKCILDRTQLHRIAYGNDIKYQEIGKLTKGNITSAYYGNNDIVTMKKSYYSGEMVYSTKTFFKKPEVITPGVTKANEEKILALQRRMDDADTKIAHYKEKQREMKGRLAEINDHINRNKEAGRSYQRQIHDQKKLLGQKSTAEEVLNTIRNQPSAEEEIRKNEENIAKVWAKYNGKPADLVSALIPGLEKYSKRRTGLIRRAVCKIEYEKVDSQLKHLENIIAEFRRQFNISKDAHEEAHTQMINARTVANNVWPYEKNGEKEIYDSLPDNLAELTTTLIRIAAQINAVHTGHRDIKAEFEYAKEALAACVRKIKEISMTITNTGDDIVRRRKAWVNEVDSIVERANESFKEVVNYMDFSAYLEFDKPKDSEKNDLFNEFGIKIMVKFPHHTEHRVLSTMAQSGGEKAISVMSFLLALQTVAKCPFRFIDEIEQGMDKKNHTMVWEAILKTTRSQHSPQYFILTPKLRDGFKYTRDVRVHLLFNGHFNHMFKRRLIEMVENEASQPVTSQPPQNSQRATPKRQRKRRIDDED